MPGPLALLLPMLLDVAAKAANPQAPGAPGAPSGGIDLNPTDFEQAESKMQAAVSKADGMPQQSMKIGGLDITPGPAAAPTPDAGLDVPPPGIASGQGTGELLSPGAFGEPDDPIGKKNMNDKLQMAALAAQLGSVLQGPGAPPPPAAPRGGGIQMTPQFMTARRASGA